MSKQVCFLGAVLGASLQQHARIEQLRLAYPEDPSLHALSMLLHVHIPLAFLLMATIRLVSSPQAVARTRAFSIMVDELLPQAIVSFRQLGIHEYAKLVLEY